MMLKGQRVKKIQRAFQRQCEETNILTERETKECRRGITVARGTITSACRQTIKHQTRVHNDVITPTQAS